jgi:hypothetical protein
MGGSRPSELKSRMDDLATIDEMKKEIKEKMETLQTRNNDLREE